MRHTDLQENITSARELATLLNLTPEQEAHAAQVLALYPMSVPPYYLSLIDWDDPDDPIRKMCIPSVEETALDGSFDTSGEATNTILDGMQHKYRQTALILSTNRCAMYCRHCFRKRLVGLSDEEIAKQLDSMFAYIREHKEITNVLISGGDSFMNSNAVLETYLKALSAIDHLDFIRFGTRVPVSLPSRITQDADLLHMLRRYTARKQVYVVTQFNHPRELTAEARLAVHLLMENGVSVKNQTVLLRGVNDNSETLAELMRGLAAIGVAPYYVFQCRPVKGVKNQFQVPFSQGYDIIEGAKKLLNGPEKCFRYAMSHETGKIEIIGKLQNGDMLFKYHQAKYPHDAGRIFTVTPRENQCWLED